jgi:hypothetical protein
MPPTGAARPDLSWVRPGARAVAVHSYEHKLVGKPSKRKFLSFVTGDVFTIVKKGKEVSVALVAQEQSSTATTRNRRHTHSSPQVAP